MVVAVTLYPTVRGLQMINENRRQMLKFWSTRLKAMARRANVNRRWGTFSNGKNKPVIGFIPVLYGSCCSFDEIQIW